MGVSGNLWIVVKDVKNQSVSNPYYDKTVCHSKGEKQ